MNKILLCGLLLCLFGAAGKGYGQEVEWTFGLQSGRSTNGNTPSLSIDGTIYIGSSDNRLYAINPDGSEKWSFDGGNDIDSSPTIGSDGTIYFGSGLYWGSNLYAINPDGTLVLI